jgi:hypothetical protein
VSAAAFRVTRLTGRLTVKAHIDKVGSTAPWCSWNVSMVYGLVSVVPSGPRTSSSNVRLV